MLAYPVFVLFGSNVASAICHCSAERIKGRQDVFTLLNACTGIICQSRCRLLVVLPVVILAFSD
jgi:hypothetical protein